ncbi:hypothetical protein BpHYR1_005528 [Brachionus plicatilis]|uniref:Uncharacterized protein n=1 Tax=Brachionus plicatilis TaxID=10195 RepID=A0A3M7Q8K9_BRAPC|nr:hypothetical protein BpHYR1_005528 [Brachionus plicatilis]
MMKIITGLDISTMNQAKTISQLLKNKNFTESHLFSQNDFFNVNVLNIYENLQNFADYDFTYRSTTDDLDDENWAASKKRFIFGVILLIRSSSMTDESFSAEISSIQKFKKPKSKFSVVLWHQLIRHLLTRGATKERTIDESMKINPSSLEISDE